MPRATRLTLRELHAIAEAIGARLAGEIEAETDAEADAARATLEAAHEKIAITIGRWAVGAAIRRRRKQA